MKEQMDAMTILFKSETESMAYNLKYLNENFNTISPSLRNIEFIYCKLNDSRSSWFDYKQALLTESTSYHNHAVGKEVKYSYEFREAIRSARYKLSPSLDELPETTYTDIDGYVHKIGPRDGLDSGMNELPLYTEEGHVQSIQGDKVIVKFRTQDVRNSIITVNGLFFDNYDFSKNESKYFNEIYDKEFVNLKKNTTIEYSMEEILHHYDFSNVNSPINIDEFNKRTYSEKIRYFKENYVFKLFKWKNVKISREYHSIGVVDGWFKFDQPVDDGCLIFYNKVLHFYEQHRNNFKEIKNGEQKQYYVRLAGDMGNINNYKSEDVTMVKLTQMVKNDEGYTENKPVKLEAFSGYLDRDTFIVRFPKPVNNALLTYNGIHHQYITYRDGYNIEFMVGPNRLAEHEKLYKNLKFEPGMDEEQYERIKKKQENYLEHKNDLDELGIKNNLKERQFKNAFLDGVPINGVNVYNWNAENVEVVNVNKNLMRNMDIIVNHYVRELKYANRKLHEIQTVTRGVYDDFVDELVIVNNENNLFTLRYPAIQDTLRLYINGVLYYEKHHYNIVEKVNDTEGKTIKWTFTGEEGINLTKNNVDIGRLDDTQEDGTPEGTNKYKVVAVYDINYDTIKEEVLKSERGKELISKLDPKKRNDKLEIIKIFREIEGQNQYL